MRASARSNSYRPAADTRRRAPGALSQNGSMTHFFIPAQPEIGLSFLRYGAHFPQRGERTRPLPANGRSVRAAGSAGSPARAAFPDGPQPCTAGAFPQRWPSGPLCPRQGAFHGRTCPCSALSSPTLPGRAVEPRPAESQRGSVARSAQPHRLLHSARRACALQLPGLQPLFQPPALAARPHKPL